MSTSSKNSGKDTGAAKAQLVAMKETRAWLQAQREREEREKEEREMEELAGVARGILRALQELIKVGKGIEEEVQKWVKEDIEDRGGWLRKERKTKRRRKKKMMMMRKVGREKGKGFRQTPVGSIPL